MVPFVVAGLGWSDSLVGSVGVGSVGVGSVGVGSVGVGELWYRSGRRVVSQGGGGGRVVVQSGAISKMASTSTDAPRGNSATPMAERAWRPAGPNTSIIRSLAPLITLGWSLKPGSLAT